MKYLNKTVNAVGLKEIADFLGENHKAAAEEGAAFFTADMLRAWAADAEFQMSEGNPARIELPARNSVTGCTQEFQISDAGLDVEEIEIEE